MASTDPPPAFSNSGSAARVSAMSEYAEMSCATLKPSRVVFANVFSIYTGPIPQNTPGIGDITFIVGFVLTGVLYYAFNMMSRRATSPAGMAGSRA